MSPLFAVVFLLSAVSAPAAAAENITGSWTGTLTTPGGSLRLAIHVDKPASGTNWSGKMDSLDQGVSGIPMSTVALAGNRFGFTIPQIGGKYSGTVSADGQQIEGTWTQGGASLPLVFKRGAAEAPKRPQNPVPPYPYEAMEVTFSHGADAATRVTLAGTLTFPKGAKGVPAVVLVSGSGPQNRDEEVMGHKPFLVLADHLTRKGIAVLRYDDRGVGKSTGSFAKATTMDFADDAAAAVSFLKTRPEVDAARIGIVGHSEGALVAPVVASRGTDNGGTAFLVLIAPIGVPGEQVLYEQAAAMNRAQGVSAEAIAANRSLQSKIFAILRNEPNDSAAAEKIKAIAGEQQAKSVATPWFRTFLTLDPAIYLSKVRVPVLSIYGELDLQVVPSQNRPAVAEALQASGNRRHTVVTLPSLNHLLQTAKTGSVTEYSRIEETIAPRALETISQWILTTTSSSTTKK